MQRSAAAHAQDEQPEKAAWCIVHLQGKQHKTFSSYRAKALSKLELPFHQHQQELPLPRSLGFSA